MPHPFSNALYYPTIDISNTGWLKTTALFWDSISTIVPESLDATYRERDTQYLSDIGFLRPLYVNSNDEAVVGIESDILSLLSSPEVIQAFFYDSGSRLTHIHRSKISYQLEETICEIQRHPIYADKLSMRIRKEIDNSINDSPQDFYYVNDSFASFYMTALANKLCESRTLAMITDTVPFFTAGNTIKFGNQSSLLTDRYQRIIYRNREMAQGILLNFIIHGLSISPETSLDEVIRFKNHHRDELGRFKVELAKLTQTYDNADKPINVVQEEIKDLYENVFLPAYNDLKKALSSFSIKWYTNSFLKISAISASATGIPMALLGFPVEQALYAGIGVSAIASIVSYNVDKRQLLRNNPYSYLFSIGREW